MYSLVIKTRTGTEYWQFTRPEFASDALKIYMCDNSDFYWRLNLGDRNEEGFQE